MASMHIPYTVEQDENGVWCAHADFVTDTVKGAAIGDGSTRDAAILDLHAVLVEMVDLYGIPHSAMPAMVLEVA